MYQETLKQLISILLDGLSRCENCSRSQPFHYCDDCKANACDTISAIVDLFNVLKPDSPDLLRDILELGEILPMIPQSLLDD